MSVVVVSRLMPCPACGCTASVQATISDLEGISEPGDLAVCIGCDAICVVTAGITLRLFADADLPYYPLDVIARIATAAHSLRRAYEGRQ